MNEEWEERIVQGQVEGWKVGLVIESKYKKGNKEERGG